MNSNKHKYRELMDDIELALGERKIYLTVPEFALLSGRHRKTIGTWCATGQLPAMQARKGGPYLIHYRQLIDFNPEVAA